jgi:hypothetical protein
MSRYLARLKALIAEDTDTRLTDATDKSPCVSFVSDQGSPLCDDESAIEERAALAADQVPACYLSAWASLQSRGPSQSIWTRGDGRSMTAGLFLDASGADAAAMAWSANELFDVPRAGRPGGLLWRLSGGRVQTLGKESARLTDGRMIRRA